MKKITLYLLLIITTISCGNSAVEKPDNLIDDDTMIEIFYDLAVIDAGKNSSYTNGQPTFVANNFIYKKYKIDSVTFAKSNKYYAADVSKYKRLFKIVRDKLNDKKTEMEKVAKAKRDLKGKV